jgi:cytochrome b subunit of formate dehydrogenase
MAVVRSLTVARGGAVAALMAALCGAWVPPAARAALPTNEECLTCHSQTDLSRSTPGRPASVYVDAARLAASAHRSVACASCHTGATSLAHPERLPRVRCSSCHAEVGRQLAGGAHAKLAAEGEDACVTCHGTHDVKPAARAGQEACAGCHAGIVAQYRGSVHGVALAHGDTDASTCKDCHGSVHAARSHLDPAAPTYRANLAATCARCHADRELVVRRKITIPEAVALYRRSVHGRSSNPKAATCNDCHESHDLRRASDPASSIYRTNIPKTCGRCHGAEAEAYAIGVHGTAVARGVTAAPVCTDCHGEHLIRGPRDPDSPVAPGGVTRTCAACHEAQGIRETFGLPAGRLSTYEDSFHGLAARGGSPVVANCASCHGDHAILPSSDPRSTVSPQRLPETCGRCHPGAGGQFAMGPVHVALTSAASEPILFWARWSYLLLIVITIGGMVLHNLLDFARKLRRRLQDHLGASVQHLTRATGRWYVRMTLSERIQHAVLAVSFLTLVYTGFALKYPESWLFAWLASLESGYAWRSLIHRVAAAVMVGTAVYHVYYLSTRRGREMMRAMVPRLRDAQELEHNLLYYVGLRKEPPAFDHFGYVEKAEYWALIWGTVVMTATGGVLWFENQSLRLMPKWVLDLATIVHYYEAWLAFLAIVVWHFYMVIVNPDAYPMNFTWLTGRISEEQMRHEHRSEWDRLMAAERAQEEAEALRRLAVERARSATAPPPAPGAGSPPQPTEGAT